MAGARRSSREPGKSDPIDAEAVALAALRHRGLPIAELDGPAREVKLLSDHRQDLVVQRSRIAQQVRWHLHELDPGLLIPSRGLRRQNVVRSVLVELERFEGVVARIARQLLGRCQELTTQINRLERELRDLVRQLAPSLLEIPGCGVLSAAVILGEMSRTREGPSSWDIARRKVRSTGERSASAAACTVEPSRLRVAGMPSVVAWSSMTSPMALRQV
ncbi:IS110 family transposase [Georgenia halophila]|uniref:IS110 family transposase n=1 Tax=Georgenia halophila TaxID=620889 RepID=UPI003CD0A4C5